MSRLPHCTLVLRDHHPLCDRDGKFCQLDIRHEGPCKPHGQKKETTMTFPTGTVVRVSNPESGFHDEYGTVTRVYTGHEVQYTVHLQGALGVGLPFGASEVEQAGCKQRLTFGDMFDTCGEPAVAFFEDKPLCAACITLYRDDLAVGPDGVTEAMAQYQADGR